jgi:hypothetical protein
MKRGFGMLPNKRFEKQNTEVGIGFAGYGGDEPQR